MSGPMYFNPTAAQVAASRASTCAMATPKDPTDCENTRVCTNKPAASGACPACHNYRPRPAAEPAIVAPLTRINPQQAYCLLDDGMGNLARVPADAWAAAHYHATTGVSS